MPIATVALPAMTIPSSTSTSNAVRNLDDSVAVSILSPAALTSTTITIQVEPTSTGTDWVTLQSGGSDVTISAVSKAIVVNPFPFRQLRVIGNASEAADRTFTVLRTVPV